jgi:peptidoglycan/LPS O-acetylase OafA/YrhL
MTQTRQPSLAQTIWLRENSSAADAFVEFAKKKHFLSLDGLRCLSILAVIWHHTAGDRYSSDSLLFMGHHGVTLFFVISGFLITTLLLREKAQHNTISLIRFYVRRALRIFPLYYLVLLIYCIAVFVLERNSNAGRNFFENLAYFATYTSNYFVALHGDRVIFYFAWSLAAEEQFYLVWPAIIKWLTETGAVIAAITAIGVALLADAGLLPWPDSHMLTVILRHIAIPICIGVLLAHLMNNEKCFTAVYRVLRYRCVPSLLLVSGLLCLKLTGIFILVAYLFMAALLFCLVTRQTGFLTHVCNTAWVIAIGQVSYGMYLFHMLVLNAIKLIPLPNFLSESPVFCQLILFLLTSLFTFWIAKLSFVYFESYFLGLKRRFIIRSETPT